MIGRRFAAIALAALTCFSMAWQTSFAAWPFTSKQAAPNSDGMKWQPTLEDAMRAASQSNKLILVHFWAPWCKECTRLERDVLSQKKVQEGVNARFVPFKLNADDYPTTVKQYGVDRLPTDLVITSTGQIVGRLKCPIEPDAYLAQLNTVANGASPTGVATNPIGAAPQISYGTPVQTAAPIMTNPASAMQPPASAVATQPAQQAAPAYAYGSPAVAAAPAAGNPAAVPAYGNDRYSEYYQRFGAAQPAAPAAQAAAATPNYTAQSPVAQYNPPPASNVQYNAPQTQSPAAVNWPANQSMMAANPALPAATGPSIVGVPSATITGVGATAAMAAPSAVGNVPSLGLDGYCPVTLADQKKWQVGDRRYGVIHRGRTYLFAGPAEQQKFLANPDHYAPAISGEDVVIAIDQGQVVEGKRQYGVEFQNRTYLFASDASRRAFSQNPQRYVAEVLQAENIKNSTVR